MSAVRGGGVFVYRVFVPAGPFWPDRGPRPVWLSAPLVVGLSRPDVSSPFGPCSCPSGPIHSPLRGSSKLSPRPPGPCSCPSGPIHSPLRGSSKLPLRPPGPCSCPSGPIRSPLRGSSRSITAFTGLPVGLLSLPSRACRADLTAVIGILLGHHDPR